MAHSLSCRAWHGVVTGAGEMMYPLVITAVSMAVILGLRTKQEKISKLTH